MSETFVNVEVEGHAPQTEHVATDRWQATCPCGYEGTKRKSLDAANADRFKHENAIGMRVEVVDSEE